MRAICELTEKWAKYYKADHFQQRRVIWERISICPCQSWEKKLAKNGLIGCWSHLSSELLIASRWWLWCSFIFKQSLVFQSHRPQSRVELQSGKFDSSTATSSSTVTSATAAPILQTIVQSAHWPDWVQECLQPTTTFTCNLQHRAFNFNSHQLSARPTTPFWAQKSNPIPG